MNASAALQILAPANYNFGMIARRDECPNYLPLTKTIRTTAGRTTYGLRDILLNSADVKVMQVWAAEQGITLDFVFTESKQWVRCMTTLTADQFASLRNFVKSAQNAARKVSKKEAHAINSIA